MFRKSIAVAVAAVTMLGSAPAFARHYDHGRYYGHGYDHHRGGRGYYGDRRCRDSGTGGAIIGAVGGGLLGNSIAGHGDKTVGTVLGAGGGALVGNAIGRSGHHRC